MYLKSLGIKGFKTFSDGESLIFDSPSGITAVVGPNGCGKSNIVDAFRFALGETNIRGLRVNSVPEVIFAGTEVRKPLSMAEVSLLFDNSDKVLPVDYADVCVKRRTFRDGESDFLINGQASRLKDIRELFLDSGLSTESLSIISQGKVDAILSSRPEDRRSVFEEVAGINKYKFRKIEAERKLILSEQNLLRISDLKVEIGEQLLSLEAQAKAAMEYKEIQEKLKNLELAVYKKQVQSLIEKRENLQKELTQMHEVVYQKEEERKKMKEERRLKQEELAKANSDYEELLLEYEKIKNSIEEEKSNLVLQKERHLFEEKEKLRDLKEEERFLSFEISRIEQSIKNLKKKKEELEIKGKEVSSYDFKEFGDFKEIVCLTTELSKILKSILVDYFGRSVDDLKEDISYEKYRKLLEIESKQIEDEINSSKEELEIKKVKLKDIKKSIAEAENKLSDLIRKTSDFERAPASELIETMMGRKIALDSKIVEVRLKKEGLASLIKNIEESAFSGQTDNSYPSLILKNEVSLAKIESELSQIENNMKTEYLLSFDDLLNFDKEVKNLANSKKEIEAFKFRLRELEPVNLLAIVEYEKCKERFSFIETQHQDILLARENLKTLIIELDLKAREDFLNSIQTVASNFSAIFSELFEGGEAQIVMEKDKDALDAGIEISVRPTGRKWLNLSLLSGGERALTAIALLFSILKTAPGPLCILDEVDAALDDANISRFVNFLKKFAKNTQIIVITHSKRTMAVADTIYGVTMEEPGVSKIISMKMKQVAGIDLEN